MSEMAVSRQSSRTMAAQGGDDDDEVGEDRAGRVGHDRLHAAHVVGEAALDLARARLGEEAQRHPLQVRVERRRGGPA